MFLTLDSFKNPNKIKAKNNTPNIAEILFGPNVPFFGSQVTENIISLLNSLGNQGTAALIVVFAVLFVYRKFLK